MNQHVDRRKLFTRTAMVMSGSAMPVVAAAVERPATDVELLRLGKELDRLLNEWRPIREQADRLGYEWDHQSDAEGVSPDYCRRKGLSFGQAEYARYFDISRETGAEAAITADHNHCALIDGVNKRIRQIPATTLSGIAVWAKALRFDLLVSKIDTPAEELDDWADEQTARFCDELDRMAGGVS